jgi:hypothetical protein
VELLLEVFPCSKIILNYRREVSEQVKSAFWKDNDTDTLLHRNAVLHTFNRRHPYKTTLVPVEDFSIPRFAILFRWLGYDCLMPRALPHSNANGSLDSLLPDDNLRLVCNRLEHFDVQKAANSQQTADAAQAPPQPPVSTPPITSGAGPTGFSLPLQGAN